jgi:hypothetical protein
MTENTLKLEIFKQLEKLNDDEQRRILQLIQSIQERPHRGTPGKELLSFAGSISKSDLSEMAQAIEQDCEKVNTYEW